MKFDYKTEYNRYRRYYTELYPLLKTPAVKAYSMLILSFLTMSVFGFFAIRPTVKTIVGLNKEINDARYTDKKLQEKINQLSDAQIEFTKVQSDMPVVKAALPADSAFQSLLKQIETVTAQSGATVSGIQFQDVLLYGQDSKTKQEASGSAAISAIPFNMTITGMYGNFSNLLRALSSIDRIVGIESISIASSSTADSGNLVITISAKAFFLP